MYRRTLGAFYNADYRMLWGANLTTYVSRWMSITTLSWFVLIQTDSAFSVSMVAFFALLPHLLLGLFGGLLADNVNKKHKLDIDWTNPSEINQFDTTISNKRFP